MHEEVTPVAHLAQLRHSCWRSWHRQQGPYNSDTTAAARRRYCEVTGHDVVACRFRVMRDDDVHGWLGASPDGLVPGLLTSSGEIWFHSGV